IEHAPFLQGDDVALVEVKEALLAELRRRAQFAGTEGGQRAPALADVGLDALEAFRQRHWLAELDALDLKAGQSCCAAGILERERQKTVVAGGEVGCGHAMLTSSLLQSDLVT